MSRDLVKIDPIIGLRYSEAVDMFSKYGVESRIAEIDGKANDLGQKISHNRVNLIIKNGVIVNYGFY